MLATTKDRAARADSLNDKQTKSFRRASIGCAQAALMLTALELNCVPVHRRATAGRDGHGESNSEIDKRFFEAEYFASLIVSIVCLSRDVARMRPLSTGGCDWEHFDAVDYVRRDGSLDSRLISAFSVKGKAMCITLNGKL